MYISGLIRFDAPSKAEVELLQRFERRNLKGIHFTFDPQPGRALMFWDSTASLATISELIELVSNNLKGIEH